LIVFADKTHVIIKHVVNIINNKDNPSKANTGLFNILILVNLNISISLKINNSSLIPKLRLHLLNKLIRNQLRRFFQLFYLILLAL